MHTDRQTDRQTGRQMDRQTDGQTDRQTHTHISNHLPEPSPLVEVSLYRAVCVRDIRSCMREKQKKDKRTRQYATTAYPLITANAQSNIHACLYIYKHIPFLRLRLNSQPPIMAGTQISSFLCAWFPHSPSPNYQSSHPHIFKYLSLLTVIFYGLQICLCVHLGGKGGRRWRISDRISNRNHQCSMHISTSHAYMYTEEFYPPIQATKA